MGCLSKGIHQDVWIGKDNSFTLRLEKVSPDLLRTPADLSSALSMTLELVPGAAGLGEHTLSVNINDPDAPIDWWNTDQVNGEVEFVLGPWAETAGVPEGVYDARLTVVDPIHPNGIVWFSCANDELTLSVHA